MAEDVVGLLSPDRNEKIFQKDILRDYLPEGMGRSEQPRLILIGGQPGAGKTTVLTASHHELAQSGPTIRIVGDDLRSYHPQFLAFQRQDPETASQFTQGDAGRWTEKLLSVAAERQVNIVFETTMRTPENVARVIEVARHAGYAVEVRAVAVNPRVSWQANHYRFEEMLHAGLAARIPPQHVHDAAIDGLRVSLGKIESEHLVDRVQLRTRGGSVIYDNERPDDQWTHRPSGRLALEREQSRPMTPGELQRFADDWHHVLARMEARSVSKDRIAAVEIRAQEDVAHLLAQRREAEGTQSKRRGRTILQEPADGHRLFVELYHSAIRDAERRPIGNVEAHAVGRLKQSYMALKLVEVARDLGLLPGGSKIVATRAFAQDKRGSLEFPAVHRLPADLAVEMLDGIRRRLTDMFGLELNRVAIDREVFSPTDRMSRLANVADSWAEAAGMRKALAGAANAVVRGVSADEALSRIIEPGYAVAIAQTRRRLERNLMLTERAAIATSIVDVNGEPLRAMRDVLRLRSAELDNRARAKAMMEAVLSETARHDSLEPAKRRAADVFVQGITGNERMLRIETERHVEHAVVSTRPLVPARELPDLSESEIGARLRQSTRLADKRTEIEHLSRLVFGNSQAASLEAIADARTGMDAGDDVRAGRRGEMAGEGRTWWRGPSPERQTAEAHVQKLAGALADYGLAIDFERHQVVTQHREEQTRQRVEIPSPSSKLAGVLSSEGGERFRSFQSDEGLRREFERLSLAVTKRLSPVDLAQLTAGDLSRFAKTHGIDEQQATKVKTTVSQVRSVQQDMTARVRERARTEAVTLVRR
ncbi:zeta toxin family protein [Sinorhizobium alkalisoli]|uniref:Zeta toxin n=1 Tax=Sinorhizobium alkalisoli TaxID=1752398 RepID=A0A1E3V7J4_9HYPH|nr:zeta toxin family protein [Sinorhizobium alkalisoli]ODR88796.1 zeta toxin [Sinorhizobium alkalisoli]